MCITHFVEHRCQTIFGKCRGEINGDLDRSLGRVFFQCNYNVLTGGDPGSLTKFFWHAEHVFTAHAGDGAAIFGTVDNGFYRNAFGSEDSFDVKRYFDTGSVQFLMPHEHGFECLFIGHF